MGVNIRNRIVRGFYFNEKVIKEYITNDEEYDELLNDMESVHWASPMTNGDVIFGKCLLESADGRYETMDIPMTNLTNLLSNSLDAFTDRDILETCVPKNLQEVAKAKGCGVYIYTEYS